jgi:hypothetical protein
MWGQKWSRKGGYYLATCGGNARDIGRVDFPRQINIVKFDVDENDFLG